MPAFFRGEEMKNIDFLLNYCNGKEKMYNKVANLLYTEFNIKSAEIALLCTFIADKIVSWLIEEGEI